MSFNSGKSLKRNIVLEKILCFNQKLGLRERKVFHKAGCEFEHASYFASVEHCTYSTYSLPLLAVFNTAESIINEFLISSHLTHDASTRHFLLSC